MRPWNGGINLWEPPQKWFRRHKQSKVYAVRVVSQRHVIRP
ncbi:hypothetical protein [Actinomyces mediterranea]|nr:hypothetical protein [Actinomyces mediterranea]